jgi:carboxyl-terminal processing protease
MRRKIAIGALVLLGLGLLAFRSSADRYFEIAKNLDIFAALFREVNTMYVDEVNPNTLVRTGIDAMLASLDPYTNYIPEDEVEDFRTMNTGQYGGIGAVTRQYGDRTVVSMIIEGFAAQKGGLQIGDEIIKIGPVPIANLSNDEMNRLMKGQIGKPVSLTVKRFGTPNPVELSFVREQIKVNNVPYSGMVSPSVGLVQLSDFTQDASKEVRTAITGLKEKGATSIILDLRNNPGGLLMEAVNIVNLFIPKGQLVVSTKGKIADNNANYSTLNPPLDTELPVVVLINRGSASASEIVAGTLQDYDRGVVIGEKSYGKGLVQVSRPLSYNSQLKVTTAKYYTPTGRCIQVLDYSHRREDGSVGAIPDSSKQAFKTKHGRVVYDGGGIDPDISIPARDIHPFAQLLLMEGYLFDYVTQYTFEHKQAPDPLNFKLSDDEYFTFVAWMKRKGYSYESGLERQLTVFEKLAQQERYYGQLKTQLDQMRNQVREEHKNDLVNHRDEIQVLLEREILSRYFLERGSAEAGLRKDPEVAKAVNILQQPAEYNKLLNIR